MNVFWFIPTHGDSRYLGTTQGARAADADYFQPDRRRRRHARLRRRAAADRPLMRGRMGRRVEPDSGDQAPQVSRRDPAGAVGAGIVGAHGGHVRPALGRPLADQRRDRRRPGGTGRRRRVPRSRHALRSHRRVPAYLEASCSTASHSNDSIDFEGKHLTSKGGKVLYPPVQDPHPPLWFGGSSAAAHEIVGEHIDTYLTWGEPPADVEKKLADVRKRVAEKGRQIKFGIRLHVIVRETEEEAWAAADKLISKLDDETIQRAQASFAKMDSEGQRRMAALHGGRRDRARGLSASVGGRRPRARRRGHGAGRQSGAGRGADEGVRGARHRYVHSLGLSASRRVVPVRRTGVSAACRASRRSASRGRCPGRSARSSAISYLPRASQS